jgi:protease-4
MQGFMDEHHASRWVALALLVALGAGSAGCVIVVGSPLGMLGRGKQPLQETVVDGEGRDKILLVDVSGMISDVPARRAFGLVEEESTVGRLEAALAKARDDDRVRALVVHVQSPGGGVTASDVLYTELRRFAREREVPIVAALGNLATSGGYYTALAADRIVAHPTTVTGSIGVIMMSLNLEGLLTKLGVEDATMKAGEHKDLLSPLRRADPAERAIVQDVLDSMHRRFVSIVRERRPALPARHLGTITDGRIFDAQTALDLGLVDAIGDVSAAIEVAKALAHLEEARVVRYGRGAEAAETLHARTPAGERPSLLGELIAGSGPEVGPRFFYLWAPAIDLTAMTGAR